MSFIRELRHKFAMKGDTKKHIFFMLAEVVLITVGIVVAMQFDDWKEKKENKKQTIVLLQQLEVEFNELKVVTLQGIESLKKGRENIEILYKACGKENNFTNYELGLLFNLASVYTRIEFDVVTLDEAINSGKISLIENSELRLLLSSFEKVMEVIEHKIVNIERELIRQKETTMKYIPWRDFDNVLFPDLELGNTQMNLNGNDIFKDPLFENNIAENYWTNQVLEGIYNEKIIARADRILELIQAELQLGKE